MGNAEATHNIIFQFNNKMLYMNEKGNYIWRTENNSSVIETPVNVTITSGFNDYHNNDIILYYQRYSDKLFSLAQYMDFRDENGNGYYAFNTEQGVYYISDENIKRYYIESTNHYKRFSYNIYVLE